MMRSALDMVSAWASVLATTKSTPSSPAAIMLLTAFPPAPPTPNTVIRGLSSRMSGIFKLIVMGASLIREHLGRREDGRSATGRIVDRVWGPSEALAKPSSDPCDITIGPCHRPPRCPRFEMFKMRRLRVDQQAGCDREGRAFRRVGKPGKAERPADAHRAIENARGEVAQAVELARAAGQNHVPARLRRERRGGKAVTHHLQNLFDPRLDDPH